MSLLIGAFRGRDNFGTFLGKRTAGVEVGTHRGLFASRLLAGWPTGTLTCVDPWNVPPGYETQVVTLFASNGDREADLAEAKRNLASFGNRARLLRMTSELAAPTFPDRSLDFVYLDANHKRLWVAADLRLWWPKLRRHGVMAGHDICALPGPDNWGPEVQPAVMEFARKVGLDVNLVVEPEHGEPWSYYLVKE